MDRKDHKKRIENEASRLAGLLGKQVDNEAETGKSVKRAIHVTAGICAAVATQPLPFADILLLTPIQATMAVRIARLHGHEVSTEQARRVLTELIGLVGLGLLAQQLAIGLYKLGLPGLGGFMTIPLVYSLTWGIGRLVDAYYQALAEGRRLSKQEVKAIFKSGRREGRRTHKEQEQS